MRRDGPSGRTVYMGVSQGRAGQDSVFFDGGTGVGALFDGHGESVGAPQSDNRWLFDQILSFVRIHDLTRSSVRNLRRFLMAEPIFPGRFRDYGVSAVIFRVRSDGIIDIMVHGDCRVYIDDDEKLPIFTTQNERERLSGRLIRVSGIDRVDGRLNVGRTIGDEVHAIGDENILFPEDVLCIRRVVSIDKSLLITSDGIRTMRPRSVRRFREVIVSGRGVRSFVEDAREDDDDASYILVTGGSRRGRG